jgi:hypothetical protein
MNTAYHRDSSAPVEDGLCALQQLVSLGNGEPKLCPFAPRPFQQRISSFRGHADLNLSGRLGFQSPLNILRA